MKFAKLTTQALLCFSGSFWGFANDHAPAEAVSAENPGGHPVLTHIDKPFRFSYGSWEGKAKVEDGVAKFHEADAKGGAGVCEKMSAAGNFKPVLRVVVGPANTTKIIKLKLRDSHGNTGTWDFDCSTVPSGTAVFLRPIGDNPLSRPHVLGENGRPPDTTKITQWQLCGDWSEAKMDLDVSLILAVPD